MKFPTPVRSVRPTIVALLLSSALVGCGAKGPNTDGTGGQTSTGGSPGTGGTIATGGASATGGTTATGGSSGTGGVASTGGAATGGANPSTGGKGGATATGGNAAGGGIATGGAQGGGSSGSCPVVNDFKDWPSGKGPAEVGKAAVGAFSSHAQDVYGSDGTAGDGYAWAFAMFGSLQFTKTTNDAATNAKFLSDFAAGIKSKTLPPNPTPDPNSPGGDKRAFGDAALEAYLQNQDANDKKLGIDRADMQWSNAGSDGITKDARYWADDMFMITGLQVYAYRATGDKKYLDRMVKTMVSYFAALQQPDGLFWHTKNSKAYWGRANGWVAVGMSDLLLELPAGADRDSIMAGYKKQMEGLLKVQLTTGTDPGAWNQVLDVTTLKPEMSCTAMFTKALVTGVKNGWLTDPKYATAARNGWLAVAARTSSSGQLSQVCPGTGDAAGSGGVTGLAAQQKFYMDIAFNNPSDNHGQAALIWAANALLRQDCPGVR